MIFFYCGTRFTLRDDGAYNPCLREFMLVESYDNDYVFQLISIGEYKPGRIIGFIREELKAKEKKVKGISKEHLISELKRNLIFEEDTLIFKED